MLDETKKKWALQWLYTNCSDKWFRPEVLDKNLNPDKTLTEALSPLEYLSLFEVLRAETYILPVVNQHGHPCFIMNQMKGQEWIEKIDSTNPSLSRIVGKMAKEGFSFTAKEAINALIALLVAAVVAFFVSR